jgi:hypothetical protein
VLSKQYLNFHGTRHILIGAYATNRHFRANNIHIYPYMLGYIKLHKVKLEVRMCHLIFYSKLKGEETMKQILGLFSGPNIHGKFEPPFNIKYQ